LQISKHLGYENAKGKAHFNGGGLVSAMKCHVCTKIERNEKHLVVK
jgi:hypothetical protein